MANRKHVIGIRVGPVIVATIAFLIVACSQAGPQATEFRGRVIDQDTGKGIAGAIVVGKYMGSRGFEGASSCNRVESAVSDQDGWFTMPIDPRDGGPLMEAYHRGYIWGRTPRWAVNGIDGNADQWRVEVVQWNADNTRAQLVRYEPTIYASQHGAIAASRQEIDVYLRPFVGTREERLKEVYRLHVAASCVGPHQTTDGPVPYFEALYAEELALNDAERSLQMTRDYIRAAEQSFARAKSKK
jgi:hypothetical protein